MSLYNKIIDLQKTPECVERCFEKQAERRCGLHHV